MDPREEQKVPQVEEAVHIGYGEATGSRMGSTYLAASNAAS